MTETYGAASGAQSGAEAGADIELTILMPCLNEAETVSDCVRKARGFLESHGVVGEVLVADNGSTDGSAALAREAGARVETVHTRGNGAALLGGIRAARGRYVIMGDADGSYDFTALAPFLEQLRAGAPLVMGNRFRGGIRPGAMPWLHRRFGNPFFSFLGRLFFHSQVHDFHCGLRGFRTDKVRELGLISTGFEFCSEMVIRAAFNGWDVVEVPTTLDPDGRSRAPHLRTWRDGARHLRFFLLYSPRWLFLYPGLALLAIGAVLAATVALRPGGVYLGSLNLDVDSLVAASALVTIGYQVCIFAILTKVYAGVEGFLPAGKWTHRARQFPLHWSLLVSSVVFVAGFVGMVVSVSRWHGTGFGTVDPRRELRLVVPSVTAMVLAIQTTAGSLFISILGIKHRPPPISSTPDELPGQAPAVVDAGTSAGR